MPSRSRIGARGLRGRRGRAQGRRAGPARARVVGAGAALPAPDEPALAYAALRREDRLPDLQSYLEIRSCSVGAMPTFYFVEYVEGFELGAAACADPRLQALHRLGTRIIFPAPTLTR